MPWWPYRFWNILSSSLRPPYDLCAGLLSCTVAKDRFWVLEVEDVAVAAAAAGRERDVRTAALVADWADGLRIIVAVRSSTTVREGEL